MTIFQEWKQKKYSKSANAKKGSEKYKKTHDNAFIKPEKENLKKGVFHMTSSPHLDIYLKKMKTLI